MGVDTTTWRARIGLNVQPRKMRYCGNALYVTRRAISLVLRLCIFLSLLVCGDIESNPGPPKLNSITGSTGTGPGSTRPSTRQSTLSYSQPDRRLSSVSVGRDHSPDRHDGDMFSFLRTMKQELNDQNQRVMNDLSAMNTKIDSISDSIKELKLENEALKKSNNDLKCDIYDLSTKMDNLEGQSRRNNIRINGINGTYYEDWNVCEDKVRDFIVNKLQLTDKKDIEIERAHRLKSKNPEKCTIIVKFLKFKDCQCILQAARDNLGRDSMYSVHQDYTERVKRHRRELGYEMVAARKGGHYASIRFDKLIIDNTVYRYDDMSRSIVSIGTRARPSRQFGTGTVREPGPLLRSPRTSGEQFDTNNTVGGPLVSEGAVGGVAFVSDANNSSVVGGAADGANNAA